jgi:glycine/D-amino acid oxidase-like deaminating enzyme
MPNTVSLPHQLSVLDRAELCVVGGGLAGVAAALVASESGVDTVLIEERGALGWEVSHGLQLFTEPSIPLPSKLARIHGILALQNAARDGVFDPVATECLLDKLLQEARVRVHFRAFAGALDTTRGIVRVTTKSGPLAVATRALVDATETSRLADDNAAKSYASGSRIERSFLLCAVQTPDAHKVVKVDGIPEIVVSPTLWPHEAHVRIVVDAPDASRAESTTRFAIARTIEALRKQLPGFAKASLSLSAHESFVLHPARIDLDSLAENVFVAGPRVLGRKPSLQERVELGERAGTRAIESLRVSA